MRDAGYDIVERVFPAFRRAPELWAEINGTDLVRVTLARFGPLMNESGRQHVEQMFGSFELGPDIGVYNDAWLERGRLLAEWARFAEEYPLVVSPVAGMPTPLLDFGHLLDAAQTAELFVSRSVASSGRAACGWRENPMSSSMANFIAIFVRRFGPISPKPC